MTTLHAIQQSTATQFASAANSASNVRFAHLEDDGAEDKVDIKKEGAKAENKGEKYTWGDYFKLPKGAGNILKALVASPGGNIYSALLWGLTLPPFTFAITLGGLLYFAFKKAGKPKNPVENITETPKEKPIEAEPVKTESADDTSES